MLNLWCHSCQVITYDRNTNLQYSINWQTRLHLPNRHQYCSLRDTIFIVLQFLNRTTLQSRRSQPHFSPTLLDAMPSSGFARPRWVSVICFFLYVENFMKIRNTRKPSICTSFLSWQVLLREIYVCLLRWRMISCVCFACVAVCFTISHHQAVVDCT